MFGRPPFSLTPWVKRIIIANALVYFLTITIFTGGWVFETFGFHPSFLFTKPWTVISYMFVHGSFFHLFFNMFGLVIFGVAVEERIGSKSFGKFFFLSGIGGPVLALLLSAFRTLGVTVGASGAVYGTLVGFAMLWPNAEIRVFPLPFPIKAKWLVLGFLLLDLLPELSQTQDGIAHFAHLGGALFGFLYLRFIDQSTQKPAWMTSVPKSTPKKKPSENNPPLKLDPKKNASKEVENRYDELDRVLDKISATGLKSLNKDERKLLDDMSDRLRKH
ncbi:MAG: rhomboid family intramembrane serine protease [Gemmatimonadota bacterium]|nr:rhomboid family intramembrane serine protease [Gemmatimonadota bacterium]